MSELEAVEFAKRRQSTCECGTTLTAAAWVGGGCDFWIFVCPCGRQPWIEGYHPEEVEVYTWAVAAEVGS